MRDLIHLNPMPSPATNWLCVQIALALDCFWMRFACSGQEFRFGNVNAVCAKEPVLYVFSLTELDLCCVRRASLIFSFDLDQALADFSFMPILSKDILHKASNVPGHSRLLIVFLLGLQACEWETMYRQTWAVFRLTYHRLQLLDRRRIEAVFGIVLFGSTRTEVPVTLALLLAGGADACHVAQDKRLRLCESFFVNAEKRQ